MTTEDVDYGSGPAGNYHDYAHYLSPEMTWVAADAWMFGDSITYGGRPQLTTRMSAAGKTIAFDAWSSRPATPAVDALEVRLNNLSYAKPSVVIMAVGTNDFIDPTLVAAQVLRAKYLCAAAGVELVWVDTFLRREGYRENDLINCAWINAQIHENIPVNRIVPWFRWFASAKSRIDARLRDGVHPIDGQGDDFWAAAIMAVVGPLL